MWPVFFVRGNDNCSDRKVWHLKNLDDSKTYNQEIWIIRKMVFDINRLCYFNVNSMLLLKTLGNLKLSYEYLDSYVDIDENEPVRYSMVWEFAPIRFNQIRLGYRKNKGIPQNDLQNSDEFFVQNHIYF